MTKPTFQKRPLTLLLVSAFVVLDILILIEGRLSSLPLSLSLFTGQMLLLGYWVVTGKISLLLRAAILIFTVPLFTILFLYVNETSIPGNRWGRYLAACYLMIAAMLMGMLFVAAGRHLKVLEREPKLATWRISVLQLLSLTAIVAVGSWIARGGSFGEMLEADAATEWLLGSFLSGVVLMLPVVPAVMVFGSVMIPLSVAVYPQSFPLFLGAVVIAGLGRLVLTLDESIIDTLEAEIED